MNEMQKGAVLGIFTRIREMIAEDPNQPLKNIAHLAEETLLAECGLTTRAGDDVAASKCDCNGWGDKHEHLCSSRRA